MTSASRYDLDFRYVGPINGNMVGSGIYVNEMWMDKYGERLQERWNETSSKLRRILEEK